LSSDVAAVAESLDVTDSMLRQILDGLLQPMNFDVRDRKFCISVTRSVLQQCSFTCNIQNYLKDEIPLFTVCMT